jgi:hypothetical protein
MTYPRFYPKGTPPPPVGKLVDVPGQPVVHHVTSLDPEAGGYLFAESASPDTGVLTHTYAPLDRDNAVYQGASERRLKTTRIYRKIGKVPTAEIDDMDRFDAEIPPDRIALFSFLDPYTGNQGIETTVQLVDGGETPGLFAGESGHPPVSTTDRRLTMEREFPDLVLPERAGGEPLYELGRLSREAGTPAAVQQVFSAVARYLEVKNGSRSTSHPGVIYVDVIRDDFARTERDYGFHPVSEESLPGLKLPSNPKGRIWMRMTVEEFIARHSGHVFPRKSPR